MTIERSTIRGGETGIRLAGAESGQSVVVKSSLVETDMPTGLLSNVEAPISVDSATFGGAGNVNLDLLGSTLIGRGPVDGGLVVNTEVGETALVDVRGSAVVATGTELRTLGTGTETISASNSAFADSAGNAPAAGSGTNISADPMLGSDFHPLAGSPLIDKSDPGFFAPGDLDLAGNARGSTPEIGAFEYLPPSVPPGPGSVPNVAPVVSLVSMSNRTFAPVRRRAAAARTVKRGTRFRYTLSEAATVSVTVERKLPGRRVNGRCVAPKPSNRTKKRCIRYKRAGVLTAKQEAGRRRLPFTGRFRGKPLRPGSTGRGSSPRTPAA